MAAAAVAAIFSGGRARCADKPRLVVNIVVSQMRYDYMRHFAHHFTEEGFKRFERDGMSFASARYDYMHTTTPAALATLTTGAEPSLHGIVSDRWTDYVSNKRISLLFDPTANGLSCDAGVCCYSPVNLIVPTLGDRLAEESPESRVVTVALDPASAVVLGGRRSDVYWVDSTRMNWVSSTAYMKQLPAWVVRYNESDPTAIYKNYRWSPYASRETYVNTRYTLEDFKTKTARYKKLLDLFRRNRAGNRTLYTPAGNSLVVDMATQVVSQYRMGKDEHTDLLNVCFDTPRYISETYGAESIELEDMYCRLDRDIANLVNFITAQVPAGEVVFVLTSDHGASDAYDKDGEPRERFNINQFKVIVNGFLNTQYGQGEWVVDYVDRQLYLNRTLMYGMGINPAEVQSRVATFVLQFRGISHAFAGSTLQNGFFGGDSYTRKIQNSYHPKRGGDVVVNLMPGWVEEDERRCSASGSFYEYDTHVPLVFMGGGIPAGTVRSDVNMTSIAPTLAYIMQISRPIAATGRAIGEVTECFDK